MAQGGAGDRKTPDRFMQQSGANREGAKELKGDSGSGAEELDGFDSGGALEETWNWAIKTCCWA